jgi:hypothetical protein
VSFYLGFCIVVILVLFPRNLRFSQRIVNAVAFPLIFAVTLAPWVIRNSAVAGYPKFSAAPDYNLYFNAATSLEAKLQHKSFAQTREESGANDQERYFQLHPEQRTWPQGEIYQFEQKEARRIILSHFPAYLFIHARGCVIVMLDPAVTEVLKTLRLYPESGGLLSRTVDQGLFRAAVWLVRQYPEALLGLIVLGIQLLLYYVFAAMGLRLLPLETTVILIFLVVYFMLVSGFPADGLRYRMPIMPLVCISAGVAVAGYKLKNKGLVPSHG